MTNDKLIVALDTPDIESAKALVNTISDEVNFYKIGLELLCSSDYFTLIKWLKEKGKKVFADLKFYDISATVGAAVKNLSKYEVDLLTIHSASKDIMLRAAENKGKMKVVAVTVLTNLDKSDLVEMGFDEKFSVEDLVIRKTKTVLDSNLDGVVSSGLEAKILRKNFGNDFLIVTPGIRLEAVASDDQKRVCDVKTAITNGSSYLVVGRPITKSADPKSEAKKFNNLISHS